MKTLYLLVTIYIALILSGCSTQSPTTIITTQTTKTTQYHHHRDELNVSFLPKDKASTPYHVLGKAEVAKYNVAGVKRQEATIKDLMREQVASVKGDAIINIKNSDKVVSGTIISFDGVLA